MVSRVTRTSGRGVERSREGATAEKGDIGERGEPEVISEEKGERPEKLDAPSRKKKGIWARPIAASLCVRLFLCLLSSAGRGPPTSSAPAMAGGVEGAYMDGGRDQE
ncbi:unnamed protein product [Spirodela intermedia]|uniref:Uncharacterized protein n=1 Tax=Spirodela intermedia TaxID=51605 RepID=A0A7I8LGE6_SPIIN|nr:unnamed protein product [Spirodela intermedia]